MISKQEMFNRAFSGLASQGWVRSMGVDGVTCVYQNKQGHRCAWGWVDRSLDQDTPNVRIKALREDKVGLASNLSQPACNFAEDLQACHDHSQDGERLKEDMIQFAIDNNLTLPEL